MTLPSCASASYADLIWWSKHLECVSSRPGDGGESERGGVQPPVREPNDPEAGVDCAGPGGRGGECPSVTMMQAHLQQVG